MKAPRSPLGRAQPRGQQQRTIKPPMMAVQSPKPPMPAKAPAATAPVAERSVTRQTVFPQQKNEHVRTAPGPKKK